MKILLILLKYQMVYEKYVIDSFRRLILKNIISTEWKVRQSRIGMTVTWQLCIT